MRHAEWSRIDYFQREIFARFFVSAAMHHSEGPSADLLVDGVVLGELSISTGLLCHFAGWRGESYY